jgi:predicted NBD/HSP70 family sugar kinase
VASMPQEVANDTTRVPPQLVSQASLWDLEQSFKARGLDPTAAYDQRAMEPPFSEDTEVWVSSAATALAHSVVSATALLDIDAVVMDGSFCRPLLQRLIAATEQALGRYNWEGLWPAQVIAGSIGSDARALGGALLPLHANFAPDRDLFLKVSN